MKILKPILISGLTIVILAWALPTVSYLNWTSLILASIVLTLLQKIAKPVLKLLFLPINIVTLGLFSLVINVALLWLATYLVPGFQIQPMTIFGLELNFFFSLLLVSFLISLLQSAIGWFL
ncbi:MAG: phage holin family protein [Candidatus Pacebacteria bacterium]|nr:phage holin family protein [Candidatus Paceibacterota bacterium]